MYAIVQINENAEDEIIKFIEDKKEFNNIIVELNDVNTKLVEYITLKQLAKEKCYIMGNYLVKIDDNTINYVRKYDEIIKGMMFNQKEYHIEIIQTWKLIKCNAIMNKKNEELLLYNYKIQKLDIEELNGKVGIFGNIVDKYNMLDIILKDKSKEYIENTLLVTSEYEYCKNRFPKLKIIDVLNVTIVDEYSKKDSGCIIYDECDYMLNAEKMVVVCRRNMLNINLDYTIMCKDNIHIDNKFQLYNNNPASRLSMQIMSSSAALNKIFNKLIEDDKYMIINDTNIYYL